MLERSMIAFALLGAEWVLYLLVFLSILSIAVMIERGIFFARRRVDVKGLAERLGQMLDKKDVDGAQRMLSGADGKDGMAALVVAEGLRTIPLGKTAVQEVMAGELVRQRQRFEQRLVFLGTLGNNAPFIGLLGTVLGIIKAFKDLSLSDPSQAGGSAQAVMAGISEALVATAVGLAVALPAVVAFNFFKSMVKSAVSATETLIKTFTARLDRLS
jgi:biopolymer transport protein ExbB